MNKNIIIGMLIACSFQMAFAAGAAKEVKPVDPNKAGHAATAGKGATEVTAEMKKLAGELKSMTPDLSEGELIAALKAPIKIKQKEGDAKVMTIKEIAEALVKSREAFRANNKVNNEHTKAMEDAFTAAVHFIKLAEVTTANSKKIADMTEVERDNYYAFTKQLSLIPDLATMKDTKDVQSHARVMEGAYQAKVKSGDNELAGDKAFGKVLESGKDEKAAKEYRKKIIDC